MQWKFELNSCDSSVLQEKYYLNKITQKHRQDASSFILKSNQSKIFAWERVGQRRVVIFIPDDDNNGDEMDSSNVIEKEDTIIQEVQRSMGGVVRPLTLTNAMSNDSSACSLSFRL